MDLPLKAYYIIYEEFEDTKGTIRIRISKKNRQHNGQDLVENWWRTVNTMSKRQGQTMIYLTFVYLQKRFPCVYGRIWVPPDIELWEGHVRIKVQLLRKDFKQSHFTYSSRTDTQKWISRWKLTISFIYNISKLNYI
jgi:hypothetical protein